MKKYTKSAFTLVELIVVITILAILATVAFISLGGQTDKARITVKKDAIGKLATAVENARTTGVSIKSFAADTSNTLTAGNIAGVAAAANTEIGAGKINLSALDVKAEDFKDAQLNDEFRFGFSNYRGGKYELAATIKNGELKTAYIAGNYEPRTATAITGVIANGTKTFKITNANDIKKLTIGDTTDLGKIVGVSEDYMTLTVDTAAAAAATSIELANTETDGLIESTTAGTPVTNNSTNVPY